MDLIGALSSQLGIDSSKAEAVAGSVLGMVRGQVQESAGDDAVGELDQAVPQLSGWMDAAKSMMGGASDDAAPAGGALGGLIGAAAGMLGGKEAQDIAKVGVLLNGLGLDASKAAMAAPVIVKFLKDKLPGGLFDTVLAAAPMLAGLGKDDGDDGNDDGGGIAGAIGSLFG